MISRSLHPAQYFLECFLEYTGMTAALAQVFTGGVRDWGTLTCVALVAAVLDLILHLPKRGK